MSNVVYDNFILENKLEDQLKTKLDLSQFLTVDNSLAQAPGMRKKINVYSGTGDVQEVAQGEGNTENMEIGFAQKEYVVGTTQGRSIYYDEQAMTDPTAIDNLIKYMNEVMVNDFTDKAIAEMSNASLQKSVSAWSFDELVEAIALFPEDNADGGFLLINKAQLAALRKQLKDMLKYVEAFSRTGYVGSIAGFNVYVSNAVPSGVAYLGFKDAVTAFVKKGVEVEQERDANIRKNSVYARKVDLVALTNAKRLVMLGASQGTTATITTYTASAKTVAGAALTGATVSIYINGVLDGDAVAASSAYSYTAKANLASGDEIKVVAKHVGYVDSIAEVTVAA